MSFLELNFSELHKTVIVLKAVNNRQRIKIMAFIYEQGEVTITDIVRKLELEESIASQYVAILKHAGIVISERKGQIIYYRIDTKRIKVIAHAISIINKNEIG